MSTSGVEAFAHRFVPAHTAGALTLLLLHGTGGDEHDLLELGRALDGQAALLSPRGQVSERGANRWFRRLAEGVFDTDDLLARTDQLAAFVTSATTHYRLDASRLVAVGFSNGANIAATLLFRHPHLLRGAVLFAPMVTLNDPPMADLSGVGVFLAAGRADPIAPPEQAERLAEQLLERGAAIELRWHPGGHGIDPHILAQATTWLGKLRAATSTAPLP
ncbi:MAG: alpha/beta hydrolase [Actinomycetota bacterium]|nr:alpha/beta hydrolase [Actinomycetota bacterium]